MPENKPLTGYPSIDKPYSFSVVNYLFVKCTSAFICIGVLIQGEQK